MDIKAEILKAKPDLLADLAALVAIPSVMGEANPRLHAPFGKEVRRAFDAFARIAERLGFTVRDDEGYAITAQIGEGEDYIGVLGHLDVVEARNQPGWRSDPFVMREEKGMLYGRGVNDDKGPLLAALYAAWMIKKRGILLKYPIRIIAGGAEETTWECMEHYFQGHRQPLCGFSPDGNFPIVNGEKGILQVRFVFPAAEGVSLYCPQRVNYVCDDLRVTLPWHASFPRAFTQEAGAAGTRLRYIGKTALSRNPQRGENAIFAFVKDMEAITCTGPLADALALISEQFLDDVYAVKCGLCRKDAQMGRNSLCVMSMSSVEEGIEVCVDIRYVKGVSEEWLRTRLEALALRYHARLEVLKHKRLLFLPASSELIISLQRAYARVMGEEASLFTKGGASYARVLDQGVAFGATFEGEDPKPHMANECQSVDSLLRACAIYYEALWELAAKKE